LRDAKGHGEQLGDDRFAAEAFTYLPLDLADMNNRIRVDPEEPDQAMGISRDPGIYA